MIQKNTKALPQQEPQQVPQTGDTYRWRGGERRRGEGREVSEIFLDESSPSPSYWPRCRSRSVFSAHIFERSSCRRRTTGGRLLFMRYEGEGVFSHSKAADPPSVKSPRLTAAVGQNHSEAITSWLKFSMDISLKLNIFISDLPEISHHPRAEQAAANTLKVKWMLITLSVWDHLFFYFSCNFIYFIV